MPTTVPPRSEVPIETTWDVASVFPDDAAWEAAIIRLQDALAALRRFQGHLADGAAHLADWLEAADRFKIALGKIYLYASCHRAVDTADQVAAAKYDRAIMLYARSAAETAFAEPEILAIAPAALRAWLRDEPRLARYAHYLDELETRREHVRSPEVEELLGQISDPFRTASETHGILADADLKYGLAHPSAPDAAPIPIAQGNIDALVADPDRETRRTAWEAYADAHLAFKNTMANCMSAGVKQNVLMARARRYPSALEAALSENHIPTAVFENVIATFQRHLPTWRRYWRARRKAWGYEQVHVYDIKAPLAQGDVRVPFRQAVDWICEGMQPLGDEYVARMRRGVLAERWVDYHPNQNKTAGAFSSGAYGAHPFVLMSYTDDLESLSTLAHELGHSMHSLLAWETQPVTYAEYSIFVAEVASNFNQALVREYLFRTQPDRDFQIGLIEEAMSNFHRYFFIMPTLARFELEIHQRVERGEALTADEMSALMAAVFREGYGDEVVMDEPRVGSTWAQFHTHLYANFYVYQYATGISAAHALADRVLSGAPGARESYLAFLRAGDSLYPLDALKLAGVDLASPEPIEKAFVALGRIVDRLEALI